MAEGHSELIESSNDLRVLCALVAILGAGTNVNPSDSISGLLQLLALVRTSLNLR